MNTKHKFLFLAFALLSFISSCINLEQTTKINEDGSGAIKLHYWTTTTNVSMSEEIGGFSFNEDKAKQNFSSANSKVEQIIIDQIKSDSTTHVRLDITFKDINKLNEAPGFSKVKTSWIKNSNNNDMDFKYIIEKDTIAAGSLGASQYKIEYKFEFPNEVISTNGITEGNFVTWNRSVTDLKENIIMNATVKTKSGICGIIGIELPVILLLGLILTKYQKKISSNLKI